MPESVMQQFDLTGKYALVTGASTGLGRAMAEALAEAGADVAVNGRSAERLQPVCDTITALGRKALPVACDVSDRDAAEAMVKTVNETFGRIDILVNNAGVQRRHKAEDFPVEDWHEVINVNLNAVFYLSQAVGRLMLKQGGGKIINTASLASFSGGITIPAYAASKGAVGQLTKALCNEWAGRNINVNAIAPGYFRTDLTQKLQDDPGRNEELMARMPAGDWGVPEQMKGAVVFLASEASTYVNGHLLVVDGGWMAR